jgi:hypothetical protein
MKRQPVYTRANNGDEDEWNTRMRRVDGDTVSVWKDTNDASEALRGNESMTILIQEEDIRVACTGGLATTGRERVEREEREVDETPLRMLRESR